MWSVFDDYYYYYYFCGRMRGIGFGMLAGYPSPYGSSDEYE